MQSSVNAERKGAQMSLGTFKVLHAFSLVCFVA
jgi:hypothetical protein